MTQAEVIWTLLSMIQVAVIGFVTYWTRRVQHLENLIAKTAEQRTQLLVEYQGRVSRLEAQFAAILELLEEIREELKDARNHRGRKGEK